MRKINKSIGLISTIAGPGTGGYNGDGIAATAAQLNLPIGIIFDNAANIYIGDWWGHLVRKITTSTGLISTIAGTGTMGYNGDGIAATAAQLDRPGWIQFDDAGNMYIGEAGNHRVRKITAATGIISTIAGTGTGGYYGDGIPATSAQLNWPISIYFDKNNCKMYIGETFNNRVRKITGGFNPCVLAVAIGNKISCQVLPAVTINNTNYNSWVPIYDSAGRIAAEINANGNTLGVVATSLFTKNGTCREDGNHRLYLNRNISITPQNQPSSPVNVRLYLLKAELDSLKMAYNSQGQPSGVASINEVDVFKNSDACAATGILNALPLSATSSSYNTNDYYLQVNVSSFSSFYFANKTLPTILHVTIASFSGRHTPEGNLLQWKANCNGTVEFVIERSSNDSVFMPIAIINANQCNEPFSYIDKNAANGLQFYRLSIIENSSFSGYSSILSVGHAGTLQLSIPSVITGNMITANINSIKAGPVQLVIMDMTGRLIQSGSFNLASGSNNIQLDTGKLAAGMYWLYVVSGNGTREQIRFIKLPSQ